MATTIYFNGRLTSIPGSYSEVDASGMASIGLGASGIVACLGEAEGAAPLTVLGITNPAKVARTFRAGDLREAGNFLFDPSNDPDIQAGAQEVRFVKVNPATQSTVTLPNGDGDALELASSDYGLFTTQINVEIAAGTNQGKAITLILEDAEEILDDVGGDNVFTVLYAPGSNGATTMTVGVAPATGVSAEFTKAATGLVADYDGILSGVAGLDGDKDANIGAGNAASVVSSIAADTTQSVTIYGVDNGTGLPVSEVLALNGVTPVVGAVLWARIHGSVLSASAAGNVTVRDNVGAVPLYVIPAGGAVVGGGLEVFSGSVEVAGVTVQIKASGATTQKMLVIGLDSADVATIEEITLNGVTYVPTVTAWNRIDALAIGYVEAGRTLTVQGLLLNSGDTLSVISSGAGDTTQTLIVYGLSAAGAAQSEAIKLNGVTPVAGVATWSKVLGATLDAATVGTVMITASTESVTVMAFDGSASLVAGVVACDRLYVDGSTISAVADGATTASILVFGTTVAGAAQVEKIVLAGAVPVAGASNWGEITGVALGHVPAARTVTISGDAFDLAVGTYATVRQVADVVNSKEGWTFAEVTTSGITFQIADMDETAQGTAIGAAKGFKADLYEIVTAINAASQLVTAAAATGATGAPSNTAAPVYLAGGVEGSTAFADWQAALDLLRSERVNTIVALTSDAAVHAAVKSHCAYMAGAGRSERDAVLGTAEAVTLASAQASAQALNTRHCRLALQNAVRYNTDGVSESFPPYFTACLAAGMQAGSPVGTSLTFKYPNLLDVEGNDASYTLVDDAGDIIDSGLLALEKVPGVGHRWLRNVTTHLIDDNIAYVEASANEAVNYGVFEFRTALEFAVGRKGFSGTVDAVVGVAKGVLDALISTGAIVTWRNLTVTLTSDVMEVDVEMAPVTPVNFVKSTIHLISTTLSAAA